MMPYKPKKPCSYPGCPELVVAGTQYCRKHKKAEQKRYDKQRGSAVDRGYDPRWQRYRKVYLAEHPLCINYAECRHAATVIDHIVPMSRGGIFWDENNHQPMCKSCHDRKTAKKDGRWTGAARNRQH